MMWFLSVLLAASVSFAGETQEVKVKGMVCSFCAQGIEKKFKERAEVQDIQVDLKGKTVKLTFKDGQKISNDEIAALLKDAGYEASF